MMKSTLLLDNFLLKTNVLIHQVHTNYIIAVSSFHSQLATSAVDSPRPPLSPSPPLSAPSLASRSLAGSAAACPRSQHA